MFLMAITIVNIIIICFFEIIYLLNIVRLGYDFWLAQADGVHHSRSGIYAPLAALDAYRLDFIRMEGGGKDNKTNHRISCYQSHIFPSLVFL